MDFIGKALAPDGTAAEETEGTEETELGGDFWDDFLSAPPLPPRPHRCQPPCSAPGACANATSSWFLCPDAAASGRIYLYQKIS